MSLPPLLREAGLTFGLALAPINPLPPLLTHTFFVYLSIFAVTKKYLKNQKIKEYVRVVSCKGGYEMKYFNIQADGDEVRTYFGL